MVRRGEDARGDARDIADCARSRSQSIQTIFYLRSTPARHAARPPRGRRSARRSVSPRYTARPTGDGTFCYKCTLTLRPTATGPQTSCMYYLYEYSNTQPR